jgi:hypothetical protein
MLAIESPDAGLLYDLRNFGYRARIHVCAGLAVKRGFHTSRSRIGGALNGSGISLMSAALSKRSANRLGKIVTTVEATVLRNNNTGDRRA